jgi:starch phosphorylase
VINRDPMVNSIIKVVFFPDFNVKNAQLIYPAADLSEQISTAGTEASGTGNMKFSMNGALTIGTLDGANIEIREAVGEENFFTFGLAADEVQMRRSGGYRPRDLYEATPELQEVVEQLGSGLFSHGDKGLFGPIIHSLLEYDYFMLLADYPLYVKCQEEVNRAWQDREQWTRMSILNVARSGRFSSDHVIREYCKDIWQAQPVPIELDEQLLTMNPLNL